MTGDPVDEYLDALEEPQRSTLRALRDSIVGLVPDAEPGIAYGSPAFKIGGKAVAGFAAFTHHVSYLPHSGSVLETLADDLAGYEWSKGALKLGLDQRLPDALLAKLIDARKQELGLE
jgi:uncharacterized protein YdhG (YjbR/CyaY superfamily)